MKKITLIFAAVLWTISMNTLFAATIYVSTTGNDGTGNGSLGNPYLTPQFAINQAVPGDIIELRGGTYMVGETRIDISNLTIRSYSGEWAILQAPINDENIVSPIYYHSEEIVGGMLENLEIIGGYYYGIFTYSNWDFGIPVEQRRGTSNITISNCRIHDTGRDCIKITPGSNNISILNCEIYNSGVGPANMPDPNAEGIDNVNGSNMIVRGCYFHDISTNAVYAKGGAKDALIENNLVVGAGEAGILLGFFTDSDYFDEVNNPQYFESIRGVVRNNIVMNTGSEGIGMYGAYQPTFYNNTVINPATNIHAGLFFNTGEIYIDATTIATPSCVDVTVYNNIIYKTSTNDNAVLGYRNNCITGTSFINNNSFYSTNTAITFSDNIAFPDMDFTQWLAAYTFDDNSIISDPLLDINYHLAAGSPCIDAGSNAIVNGFDYECGPRSGTYDIGADEYNSGLIPNVPPDPGTSGTGINTTILSVTTLQGEIVQLVVYPNPTSEFITVVSESNTNFQIELIDNAGKTIASGTNTLKIPTETANGLYLVRAVSEKGNATARVIVQK